MEVYDALGLVFGVDAVELLRRIRFLRQIKRFLRGQLHPCGELVAGNSGVQIIFARVLLGMGRIESLEER